MRMAQCWHDHSSLTALPWPAQTDQGKTFFYTLRAVQGVDQLSIPDGFVVVVATMIIPTNLKEAFIGEPIEQGYPSHQTGDYLNQAILHRLYSVNILGSCVISVSIDSPSGWLLILRTELYLLCLSNRDRTCEGQVRIYAGIFFIYLLVS